MKSFLRLFCIAAVAPFVLQNCSHLDVDSEGYIAKKVSSGLSKCFQAGLKQPSYSAKLARCETSAVSYFNGAVYVASDKNLDSPRSAFFKYFDAKKLDEVNAYLVDPVVTGVRKIEGMSPIYGQRKIVVTTAFDRVKQTSHKWDPYNTIFVFDPNNENHIKVFNKEVNDGYVSSLSIRAMLKDAIGYPYFKIEGLASIPGNRLLLGVREVGQTYKEPVPVIKVYVLNYHIKNDEYFTTGKIEELFSVDPKKLGMKEKLSLSSIEYNPADHSIFLMTSYEHSKTDTGLGAYLWRVELDKIENKRTTLIPIRDMTGSQIRFAHKAEGMTIMPGNKLLVVHDDDSVVGTKDISDPQNQFFRPLNKFSFEVLRFK